MNHSTPKRSRRFAVLTSGGDSPGMNAAIYGFVANALTYGFDPYVVYEGYQGLIENKIYSVNFVEAKQHLSYAGSFIGSSRSLEYQNSLAKRKQALANLKEKNIEGLFIIGGDGSYKGAELLADLGMPVVTAPGTIDNDVASTAYTIGFFSAMEEIYHDIEKVRMTSRTHNQIILIEVMGRRCVDLALYSGMVADVDAIVTNQNLFQIDDFVNVINHAKQRNQREVIFVVTELTYGMKYGYNLPSLPEIAELIEAKTGFRTRTSVLSYLQRGAPPTSFEILQAIKYGRKAIDNFVRKRINVAIGSDGCKFFSVPLKEANVPKETSRRQEIHWHNDLNYIK